MGTFLLWFQGDTFNVVQHDFCRWFVMKKGWRLSAKNPMRQADVESHPSKNEGWGTGFPSSEPWSL